MAQTERINAERFKRELRSLRSTLAGSCTSAIQQIEERPTWQSNNEFRQMWAVFNGARAALLDAQPEQLPPTRRSPKRQRGDELFDALEWKELFGDQ